MIDRRPMILLAIVLGVSLYVLARSLGEEESDALGVGTTTETSVAEVATRPGRRVAAPAPTTSTAEEKTDGPVLKPAAALGELPSAEGELRVIEGQVLDADGRPAVDAKVALLASGRDDLGSRSVRMDLLANRIEERALRQVRTDAEGGFRFEAREVARRFVLRATLGAAEGSLDVDLREGSGPADDLLVTLAKGLTFRGTVYDSEGQPLTGVSVAVTPNPERRGEDGGALLAGRRSTRTNEEGRFELRAPPADSSTLCATTDDGRAFLRQVGLESTEEDLELYVGGSREVRGRIRDEDGQPVAEARIDVLVTSDEGRVGSVQGRSAEDGRFLLSGLPEGRIATFSVEHPDFAPTGSAFPGQQDLIPQPGDEFSPAVPLAVTLSRGRKVSVALRRDEMPVEGVTLSLVGAAERVRRRARTDAEGRAIFDRLPAGPHRLDLVDTAGSLRKEHRLFVVEKEDLERVVVFEPGVSLTGRLVGLDVATRRRARVALTSADDRALGKAAQSARVSPEGEFRFAGLMRKGRFHLRIEAPGFASRDLSDEIPDGVETHDLGMIVLESPAAIAGVIRDAKGRPLADVSVELHVASADGELPRRARSDARGEYRFNSVTTGEVWLFASGASHAARVLGPVDIGPAEQRVGLDIALEEGLMIAGRVTNATDQPLAGARVLVRWPAQAAGDNEIPPPTLSRKLRVAQRQAVSADDGAFIVSGLPEGRPLMVTVSRTGHQSMFRTLLPADLDEALTLQLTTPEPETSMEAR